MNSKKEFIINCLDELDDYEINVISYQVNNFATKKSIYFKWQECKKQLELSEQKRLKAIKYTKAHIERTSIAGFTATSDAFERFAKPSELLEILGEDNE